MPANAKYLTRSTWQRFAKISAAILGGYMLTTAVHLCLATFLDRATVLISSTFTGFILWAALMVLAFLAKNGWKVWGIYLGLALLFSFLTFLGKF